MPSTSAAIDAGVGEGGRDRLTGQGAGPASAA